jgi:hypothetical protein
MDERERFENIIKNFDDQLQLTAHEIVQLVLHYAGELASPGDKTTEKVFFYVLELWMLVTKRITVELSNEVYKIVQKIS